MQKKIDKFLAEIKKLEEQIKSLQTLRDGKEYNDSIKTGALDALVINNEKSFKVYSEKTADETYRILIEKMDEGAVTLSNDGTILYCNLSFASLIKIPLEKIIGTSFGNFVDASSTKLVQELVKEGKRNPIKKEAYIYSNDQN